MNNFFLLFKDQYYTNNKPVSFFSSCKREQPTCRRIGVLITPFYSINLNLYCWIQRTGAAKLIGALT